MDFLFPIASIAICGPALAGIIVSRICNPEPKHEFKRQFWIAFPIALIVSTIVFLANNVIVNQAPFTLIAALFLSLVAIPVAYILSSAFSRVPSVRRYLASVYQVRQVWVWLLLAPIVMLSLDLLSIWISNLLDRQVVSVADLPFTGLTLLKMLTITFLYQLFFFNLTGEEIGWRGFALPRLLARINPIVASLVLTFFWAIWHAFYWGASGDPVLTWKYWLDTFVRLFPATVLINWFYVRSKGSILVAGVLHAISNTFFQYIPIDWPVHTAILYACAVLIILIERWWQRLPADHPAVSREIDEVSAWNPLSVPSLHRARQPNSNNPRRTP